MINSVPTLQVGNYLMPKKVVRKWYGRWVSSLGSFCRLRNWNRIVYSRKKSSVLYVRTLLPKESWGLVNEWT